MPCRGGRAAGCIRGAAFAERSEGTAGVARFPTPDFDLKRLHQNPSDQLRGGVWGGARNVLRRAPVLYNAGSCARPPFVPRLSTGLCTAELGVAMTIERDFEWRRRVARMKRGSSCRSFRRRYYGFLVVLAGLSVLVERCTLGP